jgi:hypothetical protein
MVPLEMNGIGGLPSCALLIQLRHQGETGIPLVFPSKKAHVEQVFR